MVPFTFCFTKMVESKIIYVYNQYIQDELMIVYMWKEGNVKMRNRLENISFVGAALFFAYLFAVFALRFHINNGIEILADNTVAVNDRPITLILQDGSEKTLGSGCVNIWRGQTLVFYGTDDGTRACFAANPDTIKEIHITPEDKTTYKTAKNNLVQTVLVDVIYVAVPLLLLALMILFSKWKKENIEQVEMSGEIEENARARDGADSKIC